MFCACNIEKPNVKIRLKIKVKMELNFMCESGMQKYALLTEKKISPSIFRKRDFMIILM